MTPIICSSARAREVPAGSNGMMCTFSDAMNYISWKHASPGFLNFSLDAGKFNRGVFFHALMENAALVALNHKQIVESITGNKMDSILFGSGASKSPMWCSIVSDTLGIPVTVPRVKEATALGAAILAGVGAGVYGNLNETVQRLCTLDKTYEPNMQNHEVYLELFERWKTVYRNQLAGRSRPDQPHVESSGFITLVCVPAQRAQTKVYPKNVVRKRIRGVGTCLLSKKPRKNTALGTAARNI
ncbi:MAG: FGGY-family carbohydrate kinase [Eubacteriales bacterium]